MKKFSNRAYAIVNDGDMIASGNHLKLYKTLKEALQQLKAMERWRGNYRIVRLGFLELVRPEQLELDFDEGPEFCDGPEFDGWSERSGKDNG